MPETARHYGLRTQFMDERLQPEPSAGAAAKYLRHLYMHYKDWRLAVAAYNAGEGTVDRLLAKQKQKNFDAIARKLPAETQMLSASGGGHDYRGEEPRRFVNCPVGCQRDRIVSIRDKSLRAVNRGYLAGVRRTARRLFLRFAVARWTTPRFAALSKAELRSL